MNLPLKGSAPGLKKAMGLALLLASTSLNASELTLQQAMFLAQNNDPWLRQSALREQAILADAEASDVLPDPRMSMSVLNLPTDGFALDQEPMTQLKVGLSQMLPRGDSLRLRRQQLEQLAQQQPWLRAERKAQARQSAGLLWLSAFEAQQAHRVVQKSQLEFEQLADVVKSAYASGQSNTQQQDVIEAEVEVAKLHDRLLSLLTTRDTHLARLSEWLESPYGTDAGTISLPDHYPELSGRDLIQDQHNDQSLYAKLAVHPALQAIDKGVSAERKGIELAEQAYAPQWGLNASYAYRADEPAGASRADFFSVGVSVDIPLFGRTRQDAQVTSTQKRAEAAETEKRLLMRQMKAEVQALLAQQHHLKRRLALQTQQILPQLAQQAETALSAYTNNEVLFTDVMRARINELNGQTQWVSIKSQLLATHIKLEYFLPNPLAVQGGTK